MCERIDQKAIDDYKKRYGLIVKQANVNEMKFTYEFIRNGKKEPIVTKCMLKDRAGNFFKGVSVCSTEDTPCKIVGKFFAVTRALGAFSKHMKGKTANHYFINPDAIIALEALDEIREKCWMMTEHDIREDDIPMMEELNGR